MQENSKRKTCLLSDINICFSFFYSVDLLFISLILLSTSVVNDLQTIVYLYSSLKL